MTLTIQPREKQIVALNMLRAAWKQYASFMMYAPVGFGKTAIAALIASGFISRNMRIMFVAPYIEYDSVLGRYMQNHYAPWLTRDQVDDRVRWCLEIFNSAVFVAVRAAICIENEEKCKNSLKIAKETA